MKDKNSQQWNPPEFVNKLYPVLLSIARRHLPVDTIEDVVQETINRFLLNSNVEKTIENKEAYLIGILRNVIKEYQREQHQYLKAICDRPDPAQSHEELMIEKEQRTIVRECFLKLSPEGQKLLYLHIIEERSFNELERLLGEPHSTLHRRCRENLQKLANELKKFGI